MKIIIPVLSLFLMAGSFIGYVKEAFAANSLSGKRIALIISHKNFNDTELNTPVIAFKDAGARVTVASSSIAQAVGMFGTIVKPDILYSEISPKDYAAVVFIGGAGSIEYWNDKTAQGIAIETLRAGRVLGAICLAPVTLANAGVLKDRKATVWPSEAKQLSVAGADYTGSSVQVDGDIVTADGPKSSKAFADEIMKLLTK